MLQIRTTTEKNYLTEWVLGKKKLQPQKIYTWRKAIQKLKNIYT